MFSEEIRILLFTQMPVISKAIPLCSRVRLTQQLSKAACFSPGMLLQHLQKLPECKMWSFLYLHWKKKKINNSFFCLEEQKGNLSTHKETEAVIKFSLASLHLSLVQICTKRHKWEYFCFNKGFIFASVKGLFISPAKPQHLHSLSEKYGVIFPFLHLFIKTLNITIVPRTLEEINLMPRKSRLRHGNAFVFQSWAKSKSNRARQTKRIRKGTE